MKRSTRRWLPVVLAALVPACGGDRTPSDSGPEADVGAVDKTDSGPGLPDLGVRDNGFPGDEGTFSDDVSSIDAGRTDASVEAGRPDAGTDTGVRDNGPAVDPCAVGSIIDLNAAGTLSGQTTSYAGDNTSVGTSTSLRAPTCTLGSSRVSHQIAFRYTPRAARRLRVSTDNVGTVAGLDTVVWALSTCASTVGVPLGCDDDGGEGARDFTSVFTTAAPVAAGAPVFILVAGYGADRPTGAFELTVTEVAPATAGGACDPRDASTCVTDLRCIPTGTSTTTGTCIADGAVGGRCRTVGLACDAGLGCSGTVASPSSLRCRATVAVGGTCDPTGGTNVCAAGGTCLTASGGSSCVADGAVGGRCRATDAACDAGLACSGAVASAASRCRTALAVGTACDATGAGVPCVGGSSCVSVAGNTTCMADGSLDGRCRTTGLACDGTAACSGAAAGVTSRCIVASPVGGACPAGTPCVSGTTCIASGASRTCLVNGSLGGRCRTAGLACDGAVACNGNVLNAAARCVTATPLGGACTGASLCASGTTCMSSGGSMVCAAVGIPGGSCRVTLPRCLPGLICSSDDLAEGWCLRPVWMSETCDWAGRGTACPASSACVPLTVTAGACTAAVPETEPNDSQVTATPTVTAGAVFSGSLAPGDRDCVGITLPAGASIFAQVQLPATPGCPAGGPDPQVVIYSSSGGTVISEDNTDGFGLCPVVDPAVRATARNLVAGRYVVCVSGSNAVSSYLFSVGFTP